MKSYKNKFLLSAVLIVIVLCLIVSITVFMNTVPEESNNSLPQSTELSNLDFDISSLPEFSGEPFVEVNGNQPFFSSSHITETSFERYDNLDSLGRCTQAFACIGTDIMPTKKRENISSVKPTGWSSVQYDCVDGKNLYNRCHLIGFQLSGENANKRNLITGTRFLNTQGMLPFENMVADYIKETDNHVLYRVTPKFEKNNLVATGVLMEAYSVEDNGEGITFNVFCYNSQPKIRINYLTGESRLSLNYASKTTTASSKSNEKKEKYVLNTNSHKFHKPDCKSIKDISSSNKKTVVIQRSELINQGYIPCQSCKP